MLLVSSTGLLFSSPASAAPSAASVTPSATSSAASFRGEAGVGGGSSGWAARLALEIDYWFAPGLGAGGVIAYTGQLLLNEANVVIVGPALAWRTELDATRVFFGSATLGYAEGTVTQRSLISIGLADPGPQAPPRVPVSGVAASANAGFAWAVGDAQVGTALTLDWIPSSPEAGFATTLGIMIGSPLN